jgi:type I restriction enzyme S subunit
MAENEWPTVPLGTLLQGIYDGPRATPQKTTTGPIFLGISNLSRGRLDLTHVEHLAEVDYQRWTRPVTPTSGDIVFSYETRLGEAALIPLGLRCCLGRRMGLLRVDTARADSRFVLYAWLAPKFQEEIRRRTNLGSTVDRLLLTELGDFPIVCPPLPEQTAIGGLLGLFDDKIELNLRENRTLSELRDLLLPKLVSGQIRLKDADKVVQSVL